MTGTNRPPSTRERFNISRFAIKYSWLTLGFWLAVTVAGLLAFSSLKYALFPDVTFPVVVVNATAPISQVEETESKLTIPLEQRLQNLTGLDDVRSSTFSGQSVVSLAFAVGTDLQASTKQVESNLKQAQLADGADFQIIPLNLNESAAISYTVEGKGQSISNLTKITRDQIIPPLTKIPGVLKVNLLGTPPDINNNSNNSATDSLTQGGATLVRFNGNDAIAIQIIKTGSGNTLEVVNRVEQEIRKIQRKLPNLQLNIAATQAEYIRNATQATINSLFEAIFLSVIVIYPFLRNWAATFISALAIPMSLLGTFIVMAIFGFNLETITLLALALVIGSIIDDAIVDVENIVRHVENGENTKQAALTATNEVGLPVIAATFTAVAVFLPIGLMGGVIGQFFKPFGITVSAAMLTSMLVARSLSPVLSMYLIKSRQTPKPDPQTQANTPRKIKQWGYFAQKYQDILRWCLKNRSLVMLLAGASLIAALALVPFIPKGFIPKLDRGEFNIRYTAPLPNLAELGQKAQDQLLGGFLGNIQDNSVLSVSQLGANPLGDSLEVAKQLEAVVQKNPNVDKVFTIVGSREGAPNQGILYVKLKPQRPNSTAQVQEQIRQNLPKLAEVNTSVEDIQFVDTGGQKPLQIALRGNDLGKLQTTAKTFQSRLQQLPGFADVSVSGEIFSQASSSNTKININQNEIFQIERLNNQRVTYVSANLGQNLSLGDANNLIRNEAEKSLPSGIKLDLGGDSAQQTTVLSSFGSTLTLSALSIIGILILLFRGWLDPIIIGISLPLSFVGALLALLLTGSDFGMISLIGFVFLLGLSNKNAILLVDYINQLRQEGIKCEDAILKAAPIRFRPIIMTTISTILGMLPIAVGLGAGSELRSPMAVAIAGGLVSSTILSLIVVPVLYAILDNWFPRFQHHQQKHRTISNQEIGF